MKKIILIYLLTSIFLFSNITEKYINIIQKNEIFTCDIKEKVIPLIGENFTGMYYKGRPYGLWELKNKKVRQCFLSNERRYYYKDRYYIVDNSDYYFKIDYQKNIYIIKDKKNKDRVLYFEKKNQKYIQRYGIYEELKLPKSLDEQMYFKIIKRTTIKELEDFEEAKKIFQERE